MGDGVSGQWSVHTYRTRSSYSITEHLVKELNKQASKLEAGWSHFSWIFSSLSENVFRVYIYVCTYSSHLPLPLLHSSLASFIPVQQLFSLPVSAFFHSVDMEGRKYTNQGTKGPSNAFKHECNCLGIKKKIQDKIMKYRRKL